MSMVYIMGAFNSKVNFVRNLVKTYSVGYDLFCLITVSVNLNPIHIHNIIVVTDFLPRGAYLRYSRWVGFRVEVQHS